MKEIWAILDTQILYTDGTYQSTMYASDISVGTDHYSSWIIKNGFFCYNHVFYENPDQYSTTDITETEILEARQRYIGAMFDKEVEELLKEA